MDKILEMKQARTAKFEAAKALHAKSVAENRDFTAEEQTQYDALKAEMKSLESRIARAEEVAAEEKRLAEIPDDKKGLRPDPAGGAKGTGITHTHDRELDKPFASFGENLKAIAEASMIGGQVDKRLLEMKAALGGSSGVPSDGGYLVQHDFVNEVFTRAQATGLLASRCKVVEIGPNSDGLEMPYIDETSRANGSRWGGVQVYRANEADSVTASKPKIGKLETRLEDLKGLAYATERLLQDAGAMSQIYMDAFSSEFAYKLDDEILNGTGVGQCLGILNAPCLVSVAKETNQAATTLVYQNVVKMRARLWARSRANMVWLYNQDIEPQLHTMSLAVGTGGVPVYLPATGAVGQPYDTLFGRPLIPVEQAQTLGTKGDIYAADLSQYLLIRKGGLQAASSMHVRFIQDEMTFRWTMRVNGQPMWKTALTPAKGSSTQSPFISLDTRA